MKIKDARTRKRIRTLLSHHVSIKEVYRTRCFNRASIREALWEQSQTSDYRFEGKVRWRWDIRRVPFYKEESVADSLYIFWT